MRVIELRQNVLYRFLFAPVHLTVIELTTQFEKGVQSRGRTTYRKGGQDVDQYPFVGGQVGEDVLHRPDPTCTWRFPRCFREALKSLEYRLLSILQNISCVHRTFLSSSFRFNVRSPHLPLCRCG